jgi:CheY-like chemotaxis protein
MGEPSRTDQGWALVIEGDHRNALLSRLCAEQAGLRTEVASDGAEGMARLERERPDVVLLALRLPRVSGEKILDWLQLSPHLSGVPAVVLTTQQAPDWGPEDGVFYLSKPYGMPEAREAIRTALQWSCERAMMGAAAAG